MKRLSALLIGAFMLVGSQSVMAMVDANDATVNPMAGITANQSWTSELTAASAACENASDADRNYRSEDSRIGLLAENLCGKLEAGYNGDIKFSVHFEDAIQSAP